MLWSGAYETRTHHLDTASVEKYANYQIVISKKVTNLGNNFNTKVMIIGVLYNNWV